MDGAYVVDSVTSETAPWVHAATLEQAQFVRQALRGADVLVVDLDGSKMPTLDQLFAEYKQNFSFPDYFGGNWSAFDECLKDLEWLPVRRYLTIISHGTSAALHFLWTAPNSPAERGELRVSSVDKKPA